MLDRWAALTCREANRLISERMDRPLSPAEQVRLWFHLRACELCPRVDRQMRFIRQAVRQLGH